MKQFLLWLWLVLLAIGLLGLAPAGTGQQPTTDFWLVLEPYTTGLTEPTAIAHAGDGRLFVLERSGRIRIIDSNGQLLPTPFLDISDRIDSTTYWELGLLGLAFHPDYATNGFFYVNYTDLNNDTRLSRFYVSSTDPNQANPNSEVYVLFIDQPTVIHNGGTLRFGPDGYLYVASGDGGWLGDPQNHAQQLDTLLGKILRINVTDTGPPPYYTIPPDNPFVGDPNAAPEIWAWGLRNPWAIAFDRQSGDLYIPDVGNWNQEEINFQPAASPGGLNYGWRCYEGNHSFNLTGCGPAGDYTFPVYDYTHAGACAIMGGFVYRGSQYPFLVGHYLFADFCSGDLWSMAQTDGGEWLAVQRGTSPAQISAFGEGANGELYAADYRDGTIYRLRAYPVVGQAFLPAAIHQLPPTPTPVPAGPDLIITSLTIDPPQPIAGQPATVWVTVKNQGNQPVNSGNNFFVDFYVDQLPGPFVPGDLAWGAQGANFAAGQSQTFSATYTFPAGTHALYVQADTDQVVSEANETNNILGPQSITIQP